MALINVTEAEWIEANAYFEKNPNAIKFHNKKNKKWTLSEEHEIERKESTGHNFVKIAGVVYAVNNTSNIVHEPDAGVGGFGRAKRAIDRNGRMIVVKSIGVERMKMEETKEVDDIMQTANYMLGRETRNVDFRRTEAVTIKRAGQADFIHVKGESGTVKAATTYQTNAKVLTAFEYRGDRDLFTEAFEGGNPLSLSPPQNLIIALKAMSGIKALHDLRIIHRDIKEENFVLNGQGQNLTVMPIDFDLSQRLQPGQQEIIKLKSNGSPIISGTKGYIAPEISYGGRYSYASDVYALGAMCKQMNLPVAIYSPMMVHDPQNRRTLTAAMRTVFAELSKPEYAQNPAVKQALMEYQNQVQPQPQAQVQPQVQHQFLGPNVESNSQEMQKMIKEVKERRDFDELDLDKKNGIRRQQKAIGSDLSLLITPENIQMDKLGLPSLSINFKDQDQVDKLGIESPAVLMVLKDIGSTDDGLNFYILPTESNFKALREVLNPVMLDKLYESDPQAKYTELGHQKMSEKTGVQHMYARARNHVKSELGMGGKRDEELNQIKIIFENLREKSQSDPKNSREYAITAMIYLDDLSKHTRSSTVKAVCEDYKKEINKRDQYAANYLDPSFKAVAKNYREDYKSILANAEPQSIKNKNAQKKA